MKSAKELLQRYSKLSEAHVASTLQPDWDLADVPASKYAVTHISLPVEEGITAVAFAVDAILSEVLARVREISLDSACEYT